MNGVTEDASSGGSGSGSGGVNGRGRGRSWGHTVHSIEVEGGVEE